MLLTTSVALLTAAHATPPKKSSATVLADAPLPSGGHYRTERSAVEVDRLSFARGGHSGWHSHAGPVLLVVTKGVLVNYVVRDGKCVRTRLAKGQSLLERARHAHLARNEGSREAVVVAVVNYAKGGTSADDDERPAACRQVDGGG